MLLKIGTVKVSITILTQRWSYGRPLVRPLRMFLHVLTQVGLLRVALAAVLTDVRLEVFALLVFGDVFKEGWFVAETLVAGVALVRLVGLVAPRV